ncbi:ketoacyl-ACP synthase III [uncultured Paludibaculum sp.]|uniref:3-oxoacyl-ACP synthase III family protein n=1 Tax=uncultured Paludibaculum sp. TaxID=1765020 RepID=UPI002AAB8B53|nr:ketoacyl-ACP synthase III [uncultured Paludibaculum sp.]
MAFIKEFGSWLPDRVVTSQEAGSWVGADSTWVVNVSGIEERRFAVEEDTVADLAARAGRDCLERAGVAPTDLGMVMVASGSAERSFPGPACVAAQKMGAAGVPAVDLPMASAGSLFGLSMAARLTAQIGPILVIGAEKMSRIVAREPQERGVAVLFGDGAGACLITAEKGRAEIVDSVLGTDGSYSEDLTLENGMPIKMNGRSVILQASRKIPAAIRALLDRYKIQPPDVLAFLMHQANQNLIDRVANTLGVPSAKFFSNIRKYGNTSSASMLIAACEWSQDNDFEPGLPVVFAAFGAGFNWGALLVRGV